MKDVLERVLEERKDLDIKLSKLITFVDSKDFRELPLKHQQLLIKQQTLMSEYFTVLSKRIELFQKEDKEK